MLTSILCQIIYLIRKFANLCVFETNLVVNMCILISKITQLFWITGMYGVLLWLRNSAVPYFWVPDKWMMQKTERIRWWRKSSEGQTSTTKRWKIACSLSIWFCALWFLCSKYDAFISSGRMAETTLSMCSYTCHVVYFIAKNVSFALR